MRRYSVRILRFLLVIALCAVVGGVVLAAGNGRTEVVKLPPIFTVETVADCGDFTVLESFYLEVTVMLHRDKDGQVVESCSISQPAGAPPTSTPRIRRSV